MLQASTSQVFWYRLMDTLYIHCIFEPRGLHWHGLRLPCERVTSPAGQALPLHSRMQYFHLGSTFCTCTSISEFLWTKYKEESVPSDRAAHKHDGAFSGCTKAQRTFEL